MPPGGRREARVALAMLPVGGTVLVVSTLAVAAVLCLLMMIAATGSGSIAAIAWCAAALAVGLWNMRAGIAMMSAFDWRPLPVSLLLSAGVVAGWLALP